jgi:hypothetical protein
LDLILKTRAQDDLIAAMVEQAAPTAYMRKLQELDSMEELTAENS